MFLEAMRTCTYHDTRIFVLMRHVDKLVTRDLVEEIKIYIY